MRKLVLCLCEPFIYEIKATWFEEYFSSLLVCLASAFDHYILAREMFVNMFGLLMGLFAAAFIVPISASGCYGDIAAINTTGASCLTASYGRLFYCGVKASGTLARADLKHMAQYKTIITSVAQRLCVDPALIAAIISRETRAGKGLYNGWGSNGDAWGLMQVDLRWHNIIGAWDSEEHLNQATEILIAMIGQIKRKFPEWTKEQQLKGGIAAYNVGPENVVTYPNVDGGTNGRDYSNDVVARALIYRNNTYTMGEGFGVSQAGAEGPK